MSSEECLESEVNPSDIEDGKRPREYQEIANLAFFRQCDTVSSHYRKFQLTFLTPITDQDSLTNIINFCV